MHSVDYCVSTSNIRSLSSCDHDTLTCLVVYMYSYIASATVPIQCNVTLMILMSFKYKHSCHTGTIIIELAALKCRQQSSCNILMYSFFCYHRTLYFSCSLMLICHTH